MIGGRLNGKIVGRADLLHRAEHPADQRLHLVGGRRAVRERLQPQRP